VDETGEPMDIDALVDSLRRRVEARRREGLYPLGLETQLERHFSQIVADLERPEPDIARVWDSIGRLGNQPAFSTERIALTSRLPGGRSVHGAAGKLVSRQTVGVLQQVEAFATATKEALVALAEAIATEVGARQRMMDDTISGVLDRLAVLDEMVALVRDMDIRLERLEQQAADHAS
jgi:hypothetical protein